MTTSSRAERSETMMELAACGSLEMNADRAGDARTIADLLPAGTKVYVNHLPRNALSETLKSLEALHAAGLEPVPHVAARRVTSRAALKGFLERAVDAAGVRKVLLIGGDDARPSGPYRDSLGPLGDGVIAECGIREVGLAGYPEGHARIPRAALERAMDEKLAMVSAQGLSAYVLTQFSFAPLRVIEYCAELAQRWPALPVGLRGRPSRCACCASRSAAASALRCARCARRASGPRAWSRTPIRASSCRPLHAIARRATPATWSVCTCSASAPCAKPPTG